MTQLEITIPDDVEPGQLLAIPIREDVNVKVRIPQGLGPGDIFYLCKETDQSTEWTVAVPDVQSARDEPKAPEAQSLDPPQVTQPPRLGSPAAAPAQALQPPAAAGLGKDTQDTDTQDTSVVLETSAGAIEIMVKPDWAPFGAERFLELVDAGHFEDLRIYRAVRACLVQFGLPAKQIWPPIPDDVPRGIPFKRGVVCFAATGQNSRTGTVFVCLNDLSHCLGQSPWETPIGQVTENCLANLDMVVDKYGDISECGGTGPEATRARLDGNVYLDKHFPDLTRIFHARCPNRPSKSPQPAGVKLGNTNGAQQANFSATTTVGQRLQRAGFDSVPNDGLQNDRSPRMGGALDRDGVFNPQQVRLSSQVQSYSHQPPKLQTASSPRTTSYWTSAGKRDVVEVPVELAQESSGQAIEVAVEIVKPGSNMNASQRGFGVFAGDSARGSRGVPSQHVPGKFNSFSTSIPSATTAPQRRVLATNSSTLQGSGGTSMLSPVAASRSPTRGVSRSGPSTVSSMPQTQAVRSYGRSPGPAVRGQSMNVPATRGGYQQSSVPVPPPPHASVLAMTQPIHPMQHAASFRR